MKDRLTEGEDFYYNKEGLMVLTAQYHLDRGYCCGNGCKHCPYGYDRVPEPLRKVVLDRRQEKRDEEKGFN